MKTNNNLLKGCTFTELALAYLPHDTPRAARRTLLNWVHRHPTLKKDLTRCGLNDKGLKTRQKRLTPQQVVVIFKALGEP